jgi:hypothetical protein
MRGMTRAGRLPALGGLRIGAQESPDCTASVRPPELPCGFWARTSLGRTFLFPSEGGKVRNLRNPVAPMPRGEGPLSTRPRSS